MHAAFCHVVRSTSPCTSLRALDGFPAIEPFGRRRVGASEQLLAVRFIVNWHYRTHPSTLFTLFR
jgi:hypothetical protein